MRDNLDRKWDLGEESKMWVMDLDYPMVGIELPDRRDGPGGSLAIALSPQEALDLGNQLTAIALKRGARHASQRDHVKRVREGGSEAHWISRSDDKTKDELIIIDKLLNERQRVLDAIPECPVHGSCVPHALRWIAKMVKRDVSRLGRGKPKGVKHGGGRGWGYDA